MSDRYEHYFHGCMPEQHGNLLALARYLVINAGAIDAGSGLLFDPAYMIDFVPAPADVAGADPSLLPLALPPLALPPLAHGPLAGIAALEGEDWEAYCDRAFGIRTMLPDPLYLWLQSPLWRKIEPSAKGAGLRIAYVLDFGVPHDYIEIAMGKAWTDYDRSGFLWDKLDLPREFHRAGIRAPIRQWPEWIGAVELGLRRAAITLNGGNLRETLIARTIARPEDIAGLSDAEIRRLEYMTGALPRSYRDVLSLIGHRAGRLVDTREVQIYADQLDAVNRAGREQLALWRDAPDSDPAPDDAVFIGARQGLFWFILHENRASHRRADSPVFLFDTQTGRVTQVAISVWGFVETLVREASALIDRGAPERNARRGYQSAFAALAMRNRKEQARDRLITIALMAGGVLTGTAIWLFGFPGR